MKHIFYIIVLVLTFTSCQEQAKIGYVDNSTLINEIQEKKDLETKIKGKQDTFNKKRDSISQAYSLDAQATELKLSKLSRQKQQEGSVEFQKKWGLVNQQMQFEEQQLTQLYQSEIDSLINKVKGFVKDYGKTNGYTYILGTSDGASSVLYGTDENNLTQIILEAIDAEYKK
ncbi:OmpH family outer membrane protein [Seonamhaeicola sp. ML3]|uniref:OmpH family outer membrane protein n=1 Tax=Seonamhaeicola sp. ML3 TaxID=2937786 RepID=UPI00200F4DA6|nr:OmpH family outer membrane protein [Seonamhaeicola sp. ML3]